MKQKINLRFLVVAIFMILMSFSIIHCKAESQSGVSPEKTYNIRDTGPAGGLVFYDKGHYSSGWRYLEAAPQTTEWTAQWGKHGTTIGGTSIEIGTGKDNTDLIVTKLNLTPAESGRAAQLCKELSHNGYSDWFLPSIYELNQMYLNLKQHGVGNFANDSYWSSSETDSSFAALEYLSDGNMNTFSKTSNVLVRAVRAF